MTRTSSLTSSRVAANPVAASGGVNMPMRTTKEERTVGVDRPRRYVPPDVTLYGPAPRSRRHRYTPENRTIVISHGRARYAEAVSISGPIPVRYSEGHSPGQSQVQEGLPSGLQSAVPEGMLAPRSQIPGRQAQPQHDHGGAWKGAAKPSIAAGSMAGGWAGAQISNSPGVPSPQNLARSVAPTPTAVAMQPQHGHGGAWKGAANPSIAAGSMAGGWASAQISNSHGAPPPQNVAGWVAPTPTAVAMPVRGGGSGGGWAESQSNLAKTT